jgi:membrane-bound serine protease (ClpP class)
MRGKLKDRVWFSARVSSGLIPYLLFANTLLPEVGLPQMPPDKEDEISGHPKGSDPAQVYVVPVHGPITSAQLYILRRCLKAAVEKGITAVVVDIDTPGGELQTTLEMMQVLDRFDGETMTFVRNEAVSAGVYISASTEDIYFAPKSVIGSAAVIQGTGQEIPETMKQKIDSYLMARVRAYTEEYPHRAKVIRAMMDKDFILKLDGEVLKEEGTLLSLTAKEAMQTYGNPPQSLLGAGIFKDVPSMLASRYGEGGFTIKEFEVTWSEDFAKLMNTIAPILMGLGLLGLFIEFKTPGFGVFGVTGIVLLGIVFLSNYVAGLAGHEEVLVFLLGVGLILLEIFLFPGLLFIATCGAFLILGSLIWSLADYWPGNMGDTILEEDGGRILDFTLDTFLQPSGSVMIGFLIAVVGSVLVVRFLPHTPLWGRLVLQTSVGKLDPVVTAGGSASNEDAQLPESGAFGRTVTDLFPSGEVEIDGKRYQARVQVGTIRRDYPVRVTGHQEFSLLVEEAVES